MPTSYGWTGSGIPLYQSWIDFLQSLLPNLIGLKYDSIEENCSSISKRAYPNSKGSVSSTKEKLYNVAFKRDNADNPSVDIGSSLSMHSMIDWLSALLRSMNQSSSAPSRLFALNQYSFLPLHSLLFYYGLPTTNLLIRQRY